MAEYFDIIASSMVSVITGIIGFFAGKKRSDKEIEELSLNNVEKSLSIYKEMLDDMKVRYDAEIESLKRKLNEYQAHIETLENKLKTLSSRKQTK